MVTAAKAKRLLKQRARGGRRRIKRVPPRPAWVQLEINNTCNLDCVMCPRDAVKRPPYHWSLEEFRDAADKCAAAGVSRLRPFLFGEPLLHKGLCEFIAYTKSIGIPSAEINTNASLLTEELDRELLDAGIDEIVFSLDGIDKETYESIRVGAEYESVMYNVDTFVRLAKEREPPPRLIVQTILMKGTEHQVARVVEQWRPRVDEVRIDVAFDYHGVEGISVSVQRPDDEKRPCPALYDYLVVLSDFKVVPCCFDICGEMILGDIREADISTLWTGGPITRMRKDHCAMRPDRYRLCANCEDINLGVVARRAEMSAAAMGQPVAEDADDLVAG